MHPRKIDSKGTMDIRSEKADTIIFMDIHRIIYMYRALKRYFQYRNKSRPDIMKNSKK